MPTKATTQSGSFQARSRSAQPMALRWKNSARLDVRLDHVGEQPAVGRDPRAELAEDRRTPEPQVGVAGPPAHDGGQLVGERPVERGDVTSRHLVDEVPPRARHHEVLEQRDERGVAPGARCADVEQREGGVALLAEGGVVVERGHGGLPRGAVGHGMRREDRPQRRRPGPAWARPGRAWPTSCTPPSRAPAPGRRRRRERPDVVDEGAVRSRSRAQCGPYGEPVRLRPARTPTSRRRRACRAAAGGGRSRG